MRLSLATAVAVLALGWATAPARAATVGIEAYGIATYRAAPGERNRLEVDGTTLPDATTFRDAGASIAAGAGCTPRGDGAVVCTNANGFAPLAEVDLGDGADTLTVHGGGVHALLGTGADRASANLGRLQVEGGPGPDAVSAAARTDVSVDYFDKVVGVRVTLDGRADDGAPGEGDDIGRGVRSVWGTNSRDVLDARGARGIVDLYGNDGDDRLYASSAGGHLYGSAGADILRGGPGPDLISGEWDDDVLTGAGGDDVLDAGTGRNTVGGGPGHDRYTVRGNGHDVIHARDGARDDIVCAVLPRRLDVDAVDRLTTCAFPVVAEPDPPRLLAHRRLRLLLTCPQPVPGGCRGTVRLTDTAPQPLGRARFAIAAGGRIHLTVRLHHRPRDGLVTAVVISHRALPPDSARTTVRTWRLIAP